MKEEGHLLEAAIKLSKAVSLVADENLPGQLAGIVKLHAGLAVASAFIPVSGVDAAATVANIWTMYMRINNELELPFSKNMMKSVAAGVFTNIGAAATSAIVVGSAVKILPGVGSLGGGAIMAATVYAITIASGIVYMNVIAKLLITKDATQISESDLKAATSEIMENEISIKNILKAAKNDYKEEKKSKNF